MSKLATRPSNRDLTTGEASSMLGLSRQTIIRMFEDGHLKGYRVPMTKVRRIPRGVVEAFALANGIEIERSFERKGAKP